MTPFPVGVAVWIAVACITIFGTFTIGVLLLIVGLRGIERGNRRRRRPPRRRI